MSVQVRCCRKEARLCSGLNKVCAGWMRIILKRLPKPALIEMAVAEKGGFNV